ncbi:MAG TPA: triple tyrosine motif-containing protein, partial [Rectinemataceae bacterium]|nr:triple tyrosine motif-containing protein [Rectinemataceae bacterium]
VEDREGVLWILSSRGLTSYDHGVGAFFLFGAEDGLAAGSLATGAALLAGNGELWIGGREGLSRLDPSKASRYAPQPDVVITGLEQAESGPGMRAAPLPPGEAQVILGHDNPGLVFRIAIIDYVAPSRNVYAMRLEGRQSGWTSLASQNSGYIAPLAPGRYTLRVKGSNGNGVWNDYGASLAILVRPPFWSTWWFRAIAAGLLAGLLLLLVAARLGALRKRNALLAGFARHVEEAREEERKIAARDVHDEIGQFLMVLNFQAFWLASHPDAAEGERATRLKDMQGVILDAMASVKAVATRLRPGALDALDFAGALRWYAKSIERLGSLRLVLELEEPPAPVSGDKATALFRILQEMLSNVMRHSGAVSAKVRLASESGYLVLEVIDDGRGIEEGRAEAADSFGIIGMRERCRAFGGSLSIKALSGGGTLVRARLPMAEGRG